MNKQDFLAKLQSAIEQETELNAELFTTDEGAPALSLKIEDDDFFAGKVEIGSECPPIGSNYGYMLNVSVQDGDHDLAFQIPASDFVFEYLVTLFDQFS